MKAVIFMIQSLASGEWRLSNEPESWIIVQYLGVVLHEMDLQYDLLTGT
jgi:hypothetical protein